MGEPLPGDRAVKSAAHPTQPMPGMIEIEVLQARGSSPRGAGARIWVSATETRGTIGGGNLEYTALEVARGMLFGREKSRERPVGLEDSLDERCGRAVVLRFTLREDFPPEGPPAFEVVLFGAGHVGKEVARILERLPCRLTWVDPRPEMFPAQVASNVRASSRTNRRGWCTKRRAGHISSS